MPVPAAGLLEPTGTLPASISIICLPKETQRSSIIKSFYVNSPPPPSGSLPLSHLLLVGI